ncbi:MAG: hypothetical protein RL708_728 [Bacteroidota bacterium]|jgi:hypothetical protein
MKLKFLFLFLFIANFCVAQNQLQFLKVHYSSCPIAITTFDTTSKQYFVNENQEVRLEYYDIKSNQFYEEYGAIKNITDSTLEIENEVIRINSITSIAFDKSNYSKFKRQIGRTLLIPQAVFTAGFATGLIGSFTKWDSNSSGGYGNAPFGFMLVSFVLTVLYLPIDIIALSTMSFTRHHLKFIAKENGSAWVIRVTQKTK